ncbi:hypothetical protein PACTADRAFT_47731 [Pachysolen tannophilus NRRL Y-2460]|uniref:Sister chromatid cohesion protein n=1 Tax=Pachysolen tannophilus NRRL Y-2460 TaxID=669874 RepID=A0A1E4U1L5_PACTA|nr:hypothetical protein PACTADRAFT_47731 [Pachysolen tannophilus NRRL Y-2460]
MSLPEDIIDALNNAPLTNIIPTQDIAPLLGPSPSIEILSPTYYQDADQKLNKMRNSLNENPERYKEVTDLLMSDFVSEDMNEYAELEELKFKKPSLRYNKKSSSVDKLADLKPLDRMMFDSCKSIGQNQIIKPDIKMKRIKLKYNEEEIEEQELRLQKEELCRIHKEELQNSNQRLGKRSPDKDGSENESPLKKQHIYKSSYLKPNELETKSLHDLTSLINHIGLSDDDLDIDDPLLWYEFENKEDDFEYLLSDIVLEQINDCITRLLSSKSIDTIDVNYLIRIENLCLKSLKKCLALNWNDLYENTDILKLGLNCSKSCLIIMLIFLSNRQEKQLYLEKYLLSVTDFISMSIEDGILPLTKKSVEVSKGSKALLALFQLELNKVLVAISKYLNLNCNLEENLLTRLEYLSSVLIFCEINTKEKFSSLNLNSFEDLKTSCCDILCNIFRTREDQRQFILDEVLTNVDKLPSNKGAARQFKLSRGINVQLVSVLFVRFIHCFGVSNYQFSDRFWELANKKEELKEIELKELLLENSRFAEYSNEQSNQAMKISNLIASSLLNKITNNKSKLDSASKHNFENILEDLINILGYPEWPGAELLLYSIMRTFMYVLESENYSNTIENFSLEMIGLIGCAMLSLRQNHDEFNKECSERQEFDELTKSYLNCLEYLQHSNLVNNEIGNTYFHRSSFNYEESFNFLIFKLLNKLHPLLFKLKEEDKNSFTYVNDFHMALISSVFYENNSKFFKNDVSDSNIESSSLKSYNNILMSDSLLSLYDNFLNLIVKSLDHTKIKSRTRGIKNLSSLVSRQPSLLAFPSIKSSISSRMNDNSPLVRDACIDLVSQYLDQSKPELIDEFYQVLCQRMDDSSLGVRKRVSKLLRNLYLNTNKKAVKILICQKFLKRIQEDEEGTIIELCKNALLDLWFISLYNERSPEDEAYNRVICMARIEIILDVISKNEKNWNYFEHFLNKYVIHNGEEEENAKQRQIIMEALKLLIDKTLDFIIEFVDSKEHRLKIEKSMGLLSVITKLDGKLISQDQLTSLQPYLTDESVTGDNICYYTLNIFRHSLPETKNLRPTFVNDCQLSLLRRLTKFNVKELNEAMPCLWRLSILKKDTVRISNACVSCLKLTKSYMDTISSTDNILKNENVPKILRLLYLIGNFGRYCDFDSLDSRSRKIFMKENIWCKEKDESIATMMVRYLLFFCSKDDFNHQIKRVAIRNLINICISQPKLFMDESILKVIDDNFNEQINSQNIDVKEVIIQGIADFLQEEENKNLSKTEVAINKSSSNSNKLNVDVFHGNSSLFVNDGICASLVQRYINQILANCLFDNGNHSILAINFLKLVVKLGFVNPKLIIPTVIALESNPTTIIRDSALEIHSELYEKYESLIESNYIEGIKLAIVYRMKINNNDLKAFHVENNGFLKNFMNVIGNSKNSRKKFLLSIIKTFVMNLNENDLEKLKFHKNFILFLIRNLSNCEINSLEEAYILIYGLDKTLSREGINLSLLISKAFENNDSDMKNWEKLSILAHIYGIFLKFRNFLFAMYSNLSEERVKNFKPDLKKTDKDLKNASTIKSRETNLKLEVNDLDLLIDLEDLDNCFKVCNYFVRIFSVDFASEDFDE